MESDDKAERDKKAQERNRIAAISCIKILIFFLFIS